MGRLFLFLFYTFIYVYVFSQESKIIKIPLHKCKSVGPLGSTVFLLKEADTNAIIIPDYFRNLVKSNSIQVKYFDFDFNKNLYWQYKSGVLKLDVLKSRFTRDLNDTVYYAITDSLNFDDRVYMIDGIDDNGNYIAIVDLNNNNLFDDEIFWFSKKKISDSSINLNSTSIFSNIYYVDKDTPANNSFHVEINFTNNGNIKRTSKDRRLVTLELFDNYLGVTPIKNGDFLNVFLRPVLPSSTFQNNNIILYFNKSKTPTPSLSENNKPYELSDTIIIDGDVFAIDLENSSYDTLQIQRLIVTKSNTPKQKVLEILKPAIDIISNRAATLSISNQKYLLIDFWGSWCKPCIENIPDLVSLYKKMDSTKVTFIGIVYDDLSNLKLIKDIVKKYKITWQQFLERKDLKTSNGIINEFRIMSYPTYVLLSPTGEIILKTNQLTDVKALLNKISNKK